MSGRTRVLVVDDSALVREVLRQMIDADPRFQVVATAGDPYEAWERMKALRPDVMTLDVEMPRMDGLTFLRRVMEHVPLPIVMVSSLTERGCETTLRALELGALDFVTKPAIDQRHGLATLAAEITAKLAIAARARVVAYAPRPTAPRAARAPGSQAMIKSTDRVIAVGASTGGTEALREMICAMPADAPGCVVVQHMPAGFTAAFAARLDSLAQVRVREAREGDRVLRGQVLIAPGDQHLEIVRSGAHYVVALSRGAPVNRHRPSVDVLFESCARVVGRNAVGVILTGMGDDGARGLLSMRRAGAHTIAQDEATCVVFGMPKEAIERGGVCDVLALSGIAPAALRAAQ